MINNALDTSISINNTIDSYLSDFPDKYISQELLWPIEKISGSNSANSYENIQDPTYPAKDFEQLLITPNDYYENSTSRSSKYFN